MADPKPTKLMTEAALRADQAQMQLEMELWDRARRGRIVPSGWDELSTEPKTYRRERVNFRVDEDVLKWFRDFGPDYQKRMNTCLRLFMENAISGQLSGKWERNWKGDLQLRKLFGE